MGCEACFKALEPCKFGAAAARLAEALGLDGRLGRGEPRRCLDECLENRRGEDCADLCLDVLDVAAAKSIAKRLAQEAVVAAPRAGLTAPEVAAVGLYMLLKEPEDDCISKIVSTRVLSLAAIELKSLLSAQDMLLLLAPAVAKAYDCLGGEARGLLDVLEPAVGREMAERIAAALKKGVVKIGRVGLKFPPVEPFARPP